MYYQIMSWDNFREEVEAIAAEWEDGRKELTVDEVLHELLDCMKNSDPNHCIEFNTINELESIDRPIWKMLLYTQNESEAYKARNKYFDEALDSVFSLVEEAEAIVEEFYNRHGK